MIEYVRSIAETLHHEASRDNADCIDHDTVGQYGDMLCAQITGLIAGNRKLGICVQAREHQGNNDNYPA